MNSTAEIIRLLGLVRHPEGGWYRETYRSAEKLASVGLPPRFGGERAFSTAIYFLLERGDFSSLHRIKSDEVWHFYAGTCLTVRTISPAGEARSFVLGNDLNKGEVFQAVVPAGFWFGAEVTGEGPYSLAGCTVAPGFDFADFELGSRAELLELWPAHSDLIRGLTRE
jgi:predicted cupin superfamily sugar epimerase